MINTRPVNSQLLLDEETHICSVPEHGSAQGFLPLDVTKSSTLVLKVTGF